MLKPVFPMIVLIAAALSGCHLVPPPRVTEEVSQGVSRDLFMPIDRDNPKADSRIDWAWLPLVFANAASCPKTVPGTGLSLAATLTMPKSGYASSPPGTMSLAATIVEASTPAWAAGLRPGDAIASLAGLPVGPYSQDLSAALRRLHDLTAQGHDIAVTTTDGRSLTVHPARQCDAHAWYSFEPGAAVYAGPVTVFVTKPALDKLSSADLAQLLAYELAHVAAGDSRHVVEAAGTRMEPGKMYQFGNGKVIDRATGADVSGPVRTDLASRGTRDADQILAVLQYPRDAELRAIAAGSRFAAAAGFPGGAKGLLARLRLQGIDTSYGRGLSDAEVEAAAQ
jgi:hypothetical protein